MKTVVYLNDGKNDIALKASIDSLLCFLNEDINVMVVGKELDHPQVNNIKSEEKKKSDIDSGFKLLSLAISQLDPEEKSVILIPNNCFFTAPIRLENLKIPKVTKEKELDQRSPLQIFINAIGAVYTGQKLSDFKSDYFKKILSFFPCDVVSFPHDRILTPVINPTTQAEKIISVIKERETYLLYSTDDCLSEVLKTVRSLIDETEG